MQSLLESELARVVADFDNLIINWMDYETKRLNISKSNGWKLAVSAFSNHTGKTPSTIYRWLEDASRKNQEIAKYSDSEMRQRAKTVSIKSEIEYHQKKKQKALADADSQDKILNALYQSLSLAGRR